MSNVCPLTCDFSKLGALRRQGFKRNCYISWSKTEIPNAVLLHDCWKSNPKPYQALLANKNFCDPPHLYPVVNWRISTISTQLINVFDNSTFRVVLIVRKHISIWWNFCNKQSILYNSYSKHTKNWDRIVIAAAIPILRSLNQNQSYLILMHHYWWWKRCKIERMHH